MLFVFECPSCQAHVEADASVSGRQLSCPQCGGLVAVPEARLDCGSTLGGFHLDCRLGKGGMGEVYLGTQLSVKRQVAVKVLPPGFASNPDAVTRFLYEGQLAARLDHANIVTVFEAGEDNGHFYLAMAYIEGESLDQRLKRDKALPEAEALGIVRTIADALAYAWEAFQLLHRDLKPANIMVDHRNRVFLMDLGLAKSLGDESGMTLSGSILGTPQYMSPEQAQGLSDLGVPTDVYALGATLYHLVTGTPPFTGETTLKVLHQHLYEPLPPPRERNPDVTDACSRLIETMMAKAPAERYGDWRALIADIDRVLQGQAPAANRPGAALSVGMSAPAQATAPAASAGRKASMARQAQEALARQYQSPAPKPAVAPAVPGVTKRPNRLAIGLVATVVVVLVLAGAIVASRRGRAPAPGNQAAVARPPTPAPAPVPAAADPATPATATPLTVAPSAAPPKPEPALPAAASTASSPPTQGQPWTVPNLGLELVWVEPGSFQMGSDGGEANEKPVHTVRISRGYWIGKYEVTQAEHEAAMGKNPSLFNGARNPVELVSWDDAMAFCGKLNQQEAGRLPDGYEYRLPTEAEWEYAAKGGVASKGYTCAGSDNPDEVAWYNDNSAGKTHSVGLKKPNELGLYDMSGNVWECCLDGFDGSYYGESPGMDPVNLRLATLRVHRGGAWNNGSGDLCSSRRGRREPSHADGVIGFRPCLGPALAASTPPPAAPVAVESPSAAPTPAETVAPATMPAPAPAAAPDPAQARLAVLLEQVAADLATGRPADALQRWQAGCTAPELKPLAEQTAAIGKTLGEVTSIPQRVLESLKADVGKTVEIELAKEKAICEVREVTAAGIKVNQTIKQGQGTAKLGRTLALSELSLPERLRRLGPGEAPELNLQRGLLVLEAGRPDNARRLFETAGGPLGTALAAQIETQRAQASAAAAEQALSELLRQISGSPRFDAPAKAIAAIRKRCGNDPKRREGGRRLLAEFDREWGRQEPGRTWVPVLREAFVFPFVGDAWTVPGLGLESVWIAPGRFQMGSNDGVAEEKPVHAVRIARGFWMGKYEVTQAEYEAVVGTNPSLLKGARLPVEQVSWSDAVAFCSKLTEREQKAGRQPVGYEYRLPTEAEWEYACRAGTTGDYAGGLDAMAWYEGNGGGKTHVVGQKQANAWGLHDMHGNVSEWCLDYFGPYGSGDATDPGCTVGSRRIDRGGSWFFDALRCRAADRHCLEPGYGQYYLGFRVVLAPVIPAALP